MTSSSFHKRFGNIIIYSASHVEDTADMLKSCGVFNSLEAVLYIRINKTHKSQNVNIVNEMSMKMTPKMFYIVQN